MILPGIPRIMSTALDTFVKDSTEQHLLGSDVDDGYEREAVGAFLVVPDTWEVETGWQSTVRYWPLTNKAMRAGEFSINTEELVGLMEKLLVERKEVVMRVSALNGWSWQTPWTAVVEAQEASRQQSEYIAFREEYAGSMAAATMRDDPRCGQYLHADGSVYFRLDEDAVASAVGEELARLRDSFALPDSVSLLSAPDYLMVTGHCLLGGIGHSHPNGVAGLSPQDYLSTATVEAWQRALQYRIIPLEQKEASALESVIAVGNWLYALPQEGDNGVGKLVRFTKNGIVGEWSGQFSE